MMTHHAQLFTCSLEDVFARHLDVPHPSPDVEVVSCEQLSITETRRLKALSHQRPIALSKRYFVIHTGNVTREAQNALLKLFEDPPQTAQFVLVMENPQELLPTLRSRLQEISHDKEKTDSHELTAFRALPYGERLQEIDRQMKTDEGKKWARQVLAQMEEWVARAPLQEKKALLPEVSFTMQYRRQNGASLKMLLEHVALAIPA